MGAIRDRMMDMDFCMTTGILSTYATLAGTVGPAPEAPAARRRLSDGLDATNAAPTPKNGQSDKYRERPIREVEA